MTPTEPAFSHATTLSERKRFWLGLLCAIILLAVLFGICYVLENFRQNLRENRPPPANEKAARR